ncbi:UNVERIFIED_CONTAM: Citrate synthase, mitochondrial [Sesamum calycinum]|uniref:Citrate synthase, mitochondrial n=1 Tax=Sesamum calycinum TaxID=2727403 RepID=A0AAW2IVN3_9LAMI
MNKSRVKQKEIPARFHAKDYNHEFRAYCTENSTVVARVMTRLVSLYYGLLSDWNREIVVLLRPVAATSPVRLAGLEARASAKQLSRIAAQLFRTTPAAQHSLYTAFLSSRGLAGPLSLTPPLSSISISPPHPTNTHHTHGSLPGPSKETFAAGLPPRRLSNQTPQEGARFKGWRGHPRRKISHKPRRQTKPLPEGLFWLLSLGEVPSEQQVRDLSPSGCRSELPSLVTELIDRCPTTPPWLSFSLASPALEHESQTSQGLRKGMKKASTGEHTSRTPWTSLASSPPSAAALPQQFYKDARSLPPQKDKDYSFNLAQPAWLRPRQELRLTRSSLVPHRQQTRPLPNVDAIPVSLLSTTASKEQNFYTVSSVGSVPLVCFPSSSSIRAVVPPRGPSPFSPRPGQACCCLSSDPSQAASYETGLRI